VRAGRADRLLADHLEQGGADGRRIGDRVEREHPDVARVVLLDGTVLRETRPPSAAGQDIDPEVSSRSIGSTWARVSGWRLLRRSSMLGSWGMLGLSWLVGQVAFSFGLPWLRE
jgi:hypothetical protein